jgi:hypothetical protein
MNGMWKKVLAVCIIALSLAVGYLYKPASDTAKSIAYLCFIYLLGNLGSTAKRLADIPTLSTYRTALLVDYYLKILLAIWFVAVLAGSLIGMVSSDLVEATFKVVVGAISANVVVTEGLSMKVIK